MVGKHVGLVGRKVDAVEILCLTTLVSNAVSICKEWDIETDDASADCKYTPDQCSVD